ncbi:hypothetical protein BDB01DRAFT_776895 [Pilobolus umbonatus]|nr:hypothetical protein BDB01DRAFT_776895 [Pilobolus umbonatus]
MSLHLFQGICINHSDRLCIKEHLDTSTECPTCLRPLSFDSLKEDSRYNRLVDYVQQLKRTLLTNDLTPLEPSLMNTQLMQSINDAMVREEESTQQDQSRSHAPEDMVLSSQVSYDTKNLLEEMMDNTSDYSAINNSIKHMDINMGSLEPATETSKECKWICNRCQFSNGIYLQTCGLCLEYKINVEGDIPFEYLNKIEEYHRPETYTINHDDRVETATLQTPRKRKLESTEEKKEVHIIYTGLTPGDENTLEALMKKTSNSALKIYIHYQVRDYNEITHIITSVNKQKTCRRTVKYLQGILDGKWIVEPRWLVNSIESNQWIPEDSYEVKGDSISGITHGPRKGRERMKTEGPALFADINLFFSGDFTGKHDKNDLLRLCRAGGANILKRKPNGGVDRINPNDPIDIHQPIVIVCNERKKTPSWLYQFQVRGPSWIIDCISKQEIL